MTGFKAVSTRRLISLGRSIASPVVQRARLVMSCGLTPRKLAMTLCLGIAFGIIPLVWGTSLICIVLAQLFRLNHVALQSVNYLLWPVHLALLVPFFKLGAWLFPWGPALPVSVLATALHNPGQFSLNIFGWLTCKALAAWLVTVIPSALLTYMILRATVFKEREQPLPD
jgi:uncharacterized protein (DUF2062 family)